MIPLSPFAGGLGSARSRWVSTAANVVDARTMRFQFTRFLAIFALVCASAAGASPAALANVFVSERAGAAQVARASDVVATAIGFLGVRYRRGGNTAETGFDCSGFVAAVYKQTWGHLLPHRAAEQAAVTQKIDRDDLQPGDLVFFNTMRRAFSHVGIYAGEGKFIHSPKSGAQVRVEDMTASYWQRRFNGARRVQGAHAEM